MEIAVHGRHVVLGDAVRDHAVTKVEHLGKYLQGMERAEVLFTDGKVGHSTEPVSCELMMVGHGHVVRAQGVGHNPDAALEVVVDKAALRLSRLKKRLVSRSRPRHKGSKMSMSGTVPADEADLDEGSLEGIEEL